MFLRHLVLILVLLLGGMAGALPNPATVDEGVDETLPTNPKPMESNHQRRTDNPVTIFTAKKILTMNPMQPEATAVAVQDGRILAVGSLEEMKRAALKAPVKVDETWADSVILPGFIEAHMHPHITGILWEGVYVGRFDRYTPDGKFEKGLTTKKEVLDKIAAAAKAAGDSDKWMVAWGYQPEFYNDEPLTVTDLDPITGKHPILIENASMHIYYVNSLALKIGGITVEEGIPGVMVENGKLTGEFQEIEAVKKLLPFLPKVDDKFLLKATWNAGKLAHQTGVTTIADASFGTIPGGYKAYKTATDDPNYPVRVTVYPVIDVIKSPKIQALGGLDYVKKLMKSNTDRFAIGAVKFVADGSTQGRTANLLWPYYYDTGENGVANLSQEQMDEWIGEVNAANLQCMIHTNGDGATESALIALKKALDEHPRLDHRHRITHAQLVNDNQMQRMHALGVCANIFIYHVHYWGDLHREKFLGPDRAPQMNALGSAKRNGLKYTVHSDSSVTRLDPLFAIWVAATRKTMSGKVLGPDERISVEDGLRMVTETAAYFMHQDDVKGTIAQGKLADFTILAENPLEVPVDHVKDIKVQATVLGGKTFPVDYK
ncbi:MAG: amidohydrolase [Candidatus Eremiobacteraeota bacterium]|nr:amidohydrolase [Candidatus Eremiobacteraeota bacterium]